MLTTTVSGASAPVTIGGKEYQIVALSDLDFDELSLWHQGRVLKMARASIDPETSEADKVLTLKSAYEYAKGIDFISEFRSGSMITQKEVTCRFLWKLLKKRQPALTLDAARELLNKHPEDIAGVTDAWQFLQFGQPPAEADAKKNTDLIQEAPGP